MEPRRLFTTPAPSSSDTSLIEAVPEAEESEATPLSNVPQQAAPLTLRDIFARAREQRAQMQQQQPQTPSTPMEAISSPAPQSLGGLLSEVGTPASVVEAEEEMERRRQRLLRHELILQRQQEYLEVPSEEAYSTYIIPIIPDEPAPHLVEPEYGAYLFTQSELLRSLRANPRSRGIYFSLDVPVPPSELAKWRQLGVRNLVLQTNTTVTGEVQASVPVRGITADMLKLGRSNSRRAGTFYLFYELLAETNQRAPDDPSKMIVLAYRARLLTADLRELAQGRLPGQAGSEYLAHGRTPRPVLASIAFEAPEVQRWPSIRDLRQL